LDVSEMQITSPAVHLQAAGSLGANATGLHVAINSSNFAELQSALAALGINPDLPVAVFGSASFTGTVTGTLASPRLAGHATLNNFDYLPQLQPRLPGLANVSTVSEVTPARVHWDRLVADVQYTPQQLGIQNGVLHEGDAQISAAGQAMLTNG